MPSSSPARRRIAIGFAAVLALGLAAGAGLVARHRAQPKHFETVTPDVLYRSGLLRPGNLERVIGEHGLRTVVSLLPPDDPPDARLDAERRIARAAGVRLVEIPMPVGARPSPDQIETWLALLADPASRPILVHCEHGVVRTGMMVAIYQIEHLGIDNGAALRALPMWGHDREDPQLGHMRAAIREYRPRPRVAREGSG